MSATHKTPFIDPIEKTALETELKIKKSDLAIAAIPFCTTGICFFLMAWAKQNKSSDSLSSSIDTGIVNGFLYASQLTGLFLNSLNYFRQNGWGGIKLWSLIKNLPLINLATCAALMMPGDLFSTEKSYPSGLIWTVALYMWIEEAFLLYTPLKKLLIDPLNRLYLKTKFEANQTLAHSENWECYLQDLQNKQKTPSAPPSPNSSAQDLEQTSPHPPSFKAPFISPTSEDQALPLLRRFGEEITLAHTAAPQDIYTQFFKREAFPPLPSYQSSWFSLLFSFKTLVGAAVFFLAIPFQLGATGSMERAEAHMPFFGYLPFCLLNNLLKMHSPLLSAGAGLSMLLLFTYYPTISWISTLKHLVISPIYHMATVRAPDPLLPLKSVFNWALRASMFGLCTYGLWSALAIEGEGQSQMIQDGGFPGAILRFYNRLGFDARIQVIGLAIPLNVTGLFGFLDALQTRAKLGLSQVSWFLKTTEPYSERDKALYWISKTHARLDQIYTLEDRIQMNKGKSPVNVGLNEDASLQNAFLLAKYHSGKALGNNSYINNSSNVL